MQTKPGQARIDATAQAVIDCAPDPIIALGKDRTVCVWNRAAEAMFGLARDNVVAKDAAGLADHDGELGDPEDVVCGTQGRPLSAVDEVRLVDGQDKDVPDGEPGSLLTRGPYTPRGYYRAPEQNARAFTPDGWYRSGDICRRTPQGNLIVEGRDKDMINRGGEKISA